MAPAGIHSLPGMHQIGFLNARLTEALKSRFCFARYRMSSTMQYIILTSAFSGTFFSTGSVKKLFKRNERRITVITRGGDGPHERHQEPTPASITSANETPRFTLTQMQSQCFPHTSSDADCSSEREFPFACKKLCYDSGAVFLTFHKYIPYSFWRSVKLAADPRAQTSSSTALVPLGIFTSHARFPLLIGDLDQIEQLFPG